MRKVVDQWGQKWQRDFSIRFPDDPKGNVVNFARNIVAENRGFITLPQKSQTVFHDNRAFVSLENIFFVLHFISSSNPGQENNLMEMEGKRTVFIDQAEPGKLCGFVLEVFDEDEFEDFQHFRNTFAGKVDLSGISSGKVGYTSHNKQQIQMQFKTEGFFTEATYDWGYGATEPRSFITSPPFRQPQWPSGEGYGTLPEVFVNNVRVDFESEKPVFDGPDMKLIKRLLMVSDGHQIHTVDYSGDLPTFKFSDL
ncbi:MAG: hypothetical protein ACOC4J_04440 [Bacteroidota bacterium]